MKTINPFRKLRIFFFFTLIVFFSILNGAHAQTIAVTVAPLNSANGSVIGTPSACYHHFKITIVWANIVTTNPTFTITHTLPIQLLGNNFNVPPGVVAPTGTTNVNPFVINNNVQSGTVTFDVALECPLFANQIAGQLFDFSTSCTRQATITTNGTASSTYSTSIDRPRLNFVTTGYSTLLNQSFYIGQNIIRKYGLRCTEGTLNSFQLDITIESELALDEVGIRKAGTSNPFIALAAPYIINPSYLGVLFGGNQFMTLGDEIEVQEKSHVIACSHGSKCTGPSAQIQSNYKVSPLCYGIVGHSCNNDALDLNIIVSPQSAGLHVSDFQIIPAGTRLDACGNALPVRDFSFKVTNLSNANPLEAGTLIFNDFSFYINTHEYSIGYVTLGTDLTPLGPNMLTIYQNPTDSRYTISFNSSNATSDIDGVGGFSNVLGSNLYGGAAPLYNQLKAQDFFVVTLHDVTFNCFANNSELQDCHHEASALSFFNPVTSAEYFYSHIWDMCDFADANFNSNPACPSSPSNIDIHLISNFNSYTTGINNVNLLSGVPGHEVSTFSYSFHYLSGVPPWELYSLYGNQGNLSLWNCNTNGSQPNVYAHLHLDPGYHIATGTTAILVTDLSNGHTQSVPVPVPTGNLGTTGLDYDIDYAESFVAPVGFQSVSFDFPVELDCASINNATTGQTDHFHLEFRAACNSSCPTCYITIGCADLEMVSHCFGPCPPLCVSTDQLAFNFDRSTLGWTDNTMTTHVNSSAALTNRVYECDEITSTTEGQVDACALSDANSNEYVELNYDLPYLVTANLFQLTGGNFYFDGSTTAVPLSGVPTINVIQGNPGNCTIRIPIPVAGLNIAVPHHVKFVGTFKAHDSQVPELPPGFYHVLLVKGQIMRISTSIITAQNPDGLEHSCDPYADEITFFKISPGLSRGIMNPSAHDDGEGICPSSECNVRYNIESNVFGGYFDQDDFPNEFRPAFLFPDQFSFNIDPGLSFSTSPAKMRIYSRDYSPGCNPTWLPIPVSNYNIVNAGTEIDFHNMQNFGYGTEIWRAVDNDNTPGKRWRLQFELDLDRSCPTNTSHIIDNLPITTNFTNYPTCQQITVPAAANPIAVSPNTVSTITAAFSVSQIQYVVYTNPATVDVTLSYNATGGGYISNGWVYGTSPNSAVTLQSVCILDAAGNCTTPINPVGDLFEIGNYGTIRLRLTLGYTCITQSGGTTYDPSLFDFHFGFSCTGYPLTFSASNSSDVTALEACYAAAPERLTLVPTESHIDLTGSIVGSPTVQLCQPMHYHLILKSTGPAAAYDLHLQITPPANSIFSSATWSHGANSNINLGSPTGTTTWDWNVSSLVLGAGHQPLLSGDEIIFDILVLPGCSASMSLPFSFYAVGQSTCSTPINSVAFSLQYTFDPPPNPNLTVSIVGTTSASCNGSVSYTITAHYNSAFTGNILLEACPGSFFNTTTFSSTPVATPNSGCYDWTMPTNGTGTTTVTFSMNVLPNICSSVFYIPITASTNISCTASSQTCPIGTTSNALAAVVVNCVTPSVGGTVSPNNVTLCNATNSGTLTLSGQNGNVTNWQSSTNGGITWSNISNITNSLTYTNITVPTIFRAVVQHGVCSSVYSSIATVNIEFLHLTISSSSNGNPCQGANNVTITCTGVSGVAYQWYYIASGTHVLIPGATASTYHPNQTATYYVVVRDPFTTCTAQSNTVDITIYLNPIVTISSISPICGGGSVPLIASGAYYYSWSPSSGLSPVSGAVVTANPSVNTTYTVTGMDQNGCSATASVVVNVSHLTATIHGQTTLCTGTQYSFDANANNGIGPYSYSWSTGATTQTALIIAPAPGHYTYSVTITDAAGCTSTASISVSVEPYFQIAGSTYSACNSALGNFPWHYTITNYNPTYTYIWQFITDDPGLQTSVSAVVSPGGDYADIYSWPASIPGSQNAAGSIIVTAHSSVNGNDCGDFSVTFYIEDCCDVPGIQSYTDESASSLGISGFNGQTVLLNGTFTINSGQTFYINGSTIFMGPGAQIIVENNAQLITGGSTLQAGCSEMWKGILAKKNSYVEITETVVQDAQYAVQSEDDTKIVIAKNAQIKNNYVGLYVPPNPAGVPYHITAAIYDCFFNKDATLLSPYYGQTPNPYNQYYTGILANDMDFLNVGTGVTFDRLTYGIVAYRSNLAVSSCKFTNDVGGIYNKDGTIVEKGFGKYSSTASFDHCTNGIQLIHNFSADVLDNFMFYVSSGVDAVNTTSTHFVISDNTIYYNRFGISSRFSLLHNKTEITNNDLYGGYFNPASLYGINVVEYNGTTASLTHLENNYIFLKKAVAGIYVSGTGSNHGGGNIEGYLNNIYMENSSYPNRNGIMVMNCHGNITFNENNINDQGIAGALNNRYGFYTSMTQKFHYECNYVTNARDEFYFLGDCSSSNGFMGNTMEAASAFAHSGLSLSGPPGIGIQSDAGNMWLGNFNYGSNAAGVYSPSPISNLNTRFFANNFTPYTPTIYNTYISFTSSSIPPWDCSGISQRPAIVAPTISDEVSQMIQDINDGEVDENDAAAWETMKSLYEQILSDSTTSAAYQQVMNFYDSLSYTPLADLNEVQTELNQQEQVVLDNWNLVQQNIDVMRANLAIAYANDSTLRTDTLLTETEKDNLVNSSGTLRSNMRALMHINDSLMEVNRHIDKIDLDGIVQFNSEIDVSHQYEVNERLVNDIYLNTVAQGVTVFTPMQEAVLLQVAMQCPFYGGTAVYSARGLYSLVNDSLVIDDDDVCVQYQLRSKHTAHNSTPGKFSLVVFPNPAADEITLKYYKEKEPAVIFELYDAMGEKVFSKIIENKDSYGELTINVSTLTPGIYHYAFNNIRYSLNGIYGKLVIVK